MSRAKIILSLVLSGMMSAAFAGNKERIGQAGANELLINPWTRSTGFGGANSAFVDGVEAMNMNTAGLSGVTKTELYYSNVALFSGAGISINSLGFGQRLGESGVIGLTVTSMSFGDIPVTTTSSPEGGQGTFKPQFLNLGIAYARSFSRSIHAGGAIRIINESISNVSAQAVALDAGIRYITGDYDRLKFGIALRNVGPKMKFEGDGLSQTVQINGSELTVDQRSEGFEMPALLNIGASYDLYLLGKVKPETVDENWRPSDYRLTLAGTFTSNSFTHDQVRVGAEFAFKRYIAVRAGYVYEADIFSPVGEGGQTANIGPNLGLSLMLPSKKSDESAVSFDYSYTLAALLNGTHSVGLRLNF